MQVRERERLDERDRRAVVGLALSPGKPVRTSAPRQAPGRRRAALEHDVAVSGRAVGPAHRGEEPIRAALERQVEVRAERGRDGRVGEELERELERLDRRQAQARAQAARDRGADELRERAARREIPPVRARGARR